MKAPPFPFSGQIKTLRIRRERPSARLEYQGKTPAAIAPPPTLAQRGS